MSEDEKDLGLTGVLDLCLLAALLALGGCASKDAPKVTPADTIKAGLTDAAIEAAKAPLFRLTCPSTGCVIGSLEVGNPQGAAQLADAMKVVMAPQPSEASQNYRATLAFLGPIAGYVAIGNAASNIVGKVVGGYTAGFDSNVKIAGAGFDSNVKAFDTLKEAILKPVPATADPLPTTHIEISGSGPTSIGSGNLNVGSQNPTNPTKVCTPIPATATTPARLDCG